jgi:hypothetical protein
VIAVGLLEDAVVNAKSAVNVVGKKAGQLFDISKLRINAADINNEIAKRCEALGRIVYEAKKTGNPSDELIQECINVIEELYEQLDAVNDQIAILKNRVKCKVCGSENAQEAVYCSHCGAKLAVASEEEVPNASNTDSDAEGKNQ